MNRINQLIKLFQDFRTSVICHESNSLKLISDCDHSCNPISFSQLYSLYIDGKVNFINCNFSENVTIDFVFTMFIIFSIFHVDWTALCICYSAIFIIEPSIDIFKFGSITEKMYYLIIERKINDTILKILAGAVTQTFDAMIDFRRQQARRTFLIHVTY